MSEPSGREQDHNNRDEQNTDAKQQASSAQSGHDAGASRPHESRNQAALEASERALSDTLGLAGEPQTSTVMGHRGRSKSSLNVLKRKIKLPEIRVTTSCELETPSEPLGGSSEALSGSMLNMRRSTWTLSDFEETFNSPEVREQLKCIKAELGPEPEQLEEEAPQTSQPQRASFIVGDGNKLGGSQAKLFARQHSFVSIGSGMSSDASFASSQPELRDRTKKRSQTSILRENLTQKPSSRDSDESLGARCGSHLMGQWHTMRRLIPILDWLPSYKFRAYFYGDFMAGLAVAVLNISTSLAAAVMAQTELGVAFKTSIVNTFVYALLCSSRHTSFGSYSIMSQMLLVSVRRALSDEMILDRLNMGPTASWEPHEYDRWHLKIIIMYTFLIGLIQLVCGLLNLGTILASFIPEALSSSMIAAAAFTASIGQLANMCGTTNKMLWSIEKNTTELWAELNNSPSDITDLFANLFRWAQQIALLVRYHEQINALCVVISLVSVLVLFLNQYVLQERILKGWLKRDVFVPIELILLVVMVLVSHAFDLSNAYRVPTCGPINMSIEMPNLPNLKLIRELWFQSLATALISYTTVHIMSKTYSNKCNYDVDCNQELIACGAGNLVGGLFDTMPAAASFSRTAGQVEAGGQTQMASIINCVLLLLMTYCLGHHVALLPVCVMSATLFFSFAKMMNRVSDALTYWRTCKVDFSIWMVTFCAILITDLITGFVYGFVFSILTMLYRAQNRRCYLLGYVGSSMDVYVPLVKYPIAQEVEGVKIFQFCSPIHYVCADLFESLLRSKTRVNVKKIISHIEQSHKRAATSGTQVMPLAEQLAKFNPREYKLPSHIIIDFSMISYVDCAGIHTIKKIIKDYERINIRILIASMASHVAGMFKKDATLWNSYKDRFYVTLADAVSVAIAAGPPVKDGIAFVVNQEKTNLANLRKLSLVGPP